LTPHSVILNFYFTSYLFRSLAAQEPKKLLKNVLLIVPPLEVLREVWEDYHLVAGRRWQAPLTVVLKIRERSPSMLGNIDDIPLRRWCQIYESVHHQR
jgi:hypothetical protein